MIERSMTVKWRNLMASLCIYPLCTTYYVCCAKKSKWLRFRGHVHFTAAIADLLSCEWEGCRASQSRMIGCVLNVGKCIVYIGRVAKSRNASLALFFFLGVVRNENADHHNHHQIVALFARIWPLDCIQMDWKVWMKIGTLHLAAPADVKVARQVRVWCEPFAQSGIDLPQWMFAESSLSSLAYFTNRTTIAPMLAHRFQVRAMTTTKTM